MEVGDKTPTFEDTEPVESTTPSFEDTEEVVPETVKKKVETTGNTSTTKSQPSLGASDSDGQSISSSPYFLTVSDTGPSSSGEKSVVKAEEIKSSLPELKDKAKHLALNNGLNTKEAIDAYGKKLNMFGYSKSEVDLVKQHAEKVASTATMYNDLKAHLNKNPKDRNANYALGAIELNNGDLGAAISFFSNALTLPQQAPAQATSENPYPQQAAASDSNALYGIGYAKQKMGDDDEAEQYYMDAIKADPKNPYAIKGLASIKSKKGDTQNAKQLLDYANQVGAPQQKLEAQAAGYREEKAHENDRAEYLKTIADGLENLFNSVNPAAAVGSGIEQGIKSIKEAPEVYGKEGAASGALRLGQGVAQIGLGILMGTPEGMVFNAGAGAAQTVLPDELTKFLMAPATTLLDSSGVPSSEAEKSLASFGDIISQALIMKGIHGKNAEAKALGEKFKNNEPITIDEWTKFKEMAAGITDEEIAEATKKVNEPTEIKDKKLSALSTKAEQLQKSLETAKDGEGKQLIEDQLKDVEYKIAERRSDMINEHHESAAVEAKATDLTKRINDLEGDVKDIPEDNPEARKVLENKIEELNTELKTIKPTEDAVQEQSASSVLQYPQEGAGETGSERGGVEPIEQGNEVTQTREEPKQKESIRKENEKQIEEPAIPNETKKLKNETSKGAERIVEADALGEAEEEIKAGIQEKGLKYVPTSRTMTHENVKKYIDHFEQADKLDKAAEHLTDTANGMTGTVRALVGAELFKRYAQKANEALTPQERTELSQKAVRIGQISTERFREAGKEVEAAKVWKEMLKKTPEGAITLLKNEYTERNNGALKQHEGSIKEAKKFFDKVLQSEEFKKAVEKGVGEEIEKRGEVLFGKEQKKKVVDFFDALKVDVKGKAFDATLGIPVAVYNAAIETIKQSVLLGANAANAIKSGIDKIKELHLGEWDEKKFEADIAEKLKSAGIKTKGEKASKISREPSKELQKSILDKWAKRLDKLSDKSRQQLLADSIETLTKEGALSDERFKELYSKALGLSTVTPEIETKIRSLIDTINKGDKVAENLQRLLKENASEEELKTAVKDWEKTNRDAGYANEEIASMFRKEKRISNTIISAMLGNMLSTTSVVFSAAYNAANSPIRLLNRGLSSAGDFLVSQVAKTKLLNKILGSKAPSEQRAIDALAAWKGQLQGIGPATKEAGIQFVKGETQKDYTRYELHQKVEPIKAWKELIDGPITHVVDYLMNKPHQEKLNGYKQLNNFIEGTVGVPGTVIFRALNLTDKPFRDAAQHGALREIGVLKGLKDNALREFMMFPDAESLEKSMTQGEHATLQQSEGIVKQIQDAISKLGAWSENQEGVARYVASAARILAKSQVPFIKMPLNAVMLTAKYALPEVTLLPNAIRHALQGNRRLALENFAEFITASSIKFVAKSLIDQGMATGNIEGDDKKKSNVRSLIYENIKPYSLNISALKRTMAGGSAAPEKTDQWVNYQKLGLFGSMLAFHTSAQNKKAEDYSWVDDIMGRGLAMSQTTLEQSFLQNTNQLLNALSGGASDQRRWEMGTLGALGSIFWPNTLTNISNATLDEYKETKDKSNLQEIQNVFKKKMFMGDKLPSKITLWGEPVKNTPEGVNPVMYNLFYIHKPYQVNTDMFGYKIYDEWKKTGDDGLIPTFPKSTFKVDGNKIELNPEQRESYYRFVGRQRADLVSYYINSGDFEADDLETKKKKLKELYNQGQKLGRELLFDKYPKLEIDSEEE